MKDSGEGYHLILMSYWRTVSDWFIDYLQDNSVRRIVYIMNADKHRLVENPDFVFNDFEIFKNAGFEVELVDLDNVKDFDDLFKDKDLIYVRGGNTFELLNSIKKSGFDKLLPRILESGIIYASSSAGSIILGPNIEVAENDFMSDYNNVGLVDLRGLNIVNFSVFPHWKEIWRKNLDKLIMNKKVNYEVKTLEDNQVIIIKEGKEELISL